MKPFVMHRKMRTVGGAFYPTGWVVAMVPAEDVEHLGKELTAKGFHSEDVLHLPPDLLLSELGGAVGESDLPLPSVGTEGESVRKYLDLARQGLHGLMVHAPDDADTERAMQVLRPVPVAYAQKYHRLMIEDLE